MPWDLGALHWRDLAEDTDVWSFLHEGSSVGPGAGMLGDVQSAFIPLPPPVGLMMGKGRECTHLPGSGAPSSVRIPSFSRDSLLPNSGTKKARVWKPAAWGTADTTGFCLHIVLLSSAQLLDVRRQCVGA